MCDPDVLTQLGLFFNIVLIVPKVLAGYFDTLLLTDIVARMKWSVIRGFESSVYQFISRSWFLTGIKHYVLKRFGISIEIHRKLSSIKKDNLDEQDYEMLRNL